MNSAGAVSLGDSWSVDDCDVGRGAGSGKACAVGEGDEGPCRDCAIGAGDSNSCAVLVVVRLSKDEVTGATSDVSSCSTMGRRSGNGEPGGDGRRICSGVSSGGTCSEAASLAWCVNRSAAPCSTVDVEGCLGAGGVCCTGLVASGMRERCARSSEIRVPRRLKAVRRVVGDS